MTDRTEGGHQGSSSEDLIRQARENYVPTDYAAPRPFESEMSGIDAPRYATPASGPITRPSDYVRSEYLDQTAPAGTIPAATTYQAESRSFFARYGRLLVFGVIILGFVLYAMFDKTKSVEALAVGDCLLMPAEEEITDVESAACDGDHQLEVFAIVTLSASSSTPYPGDDAVAEGIFELCMPSFQPYVGATFEESIWWVNAIYPSPESWEEENDREGKCVLFQPGEGEEVLMLQGSARGSNE